MKYGDLILIMLGIIVLMSIGYVLGVNNSLWFLPLIFVALFSFMFFDLKLRK